MPSIDQKFVQRLDDFTKSLEGIVEILKEDTKKGNVDNVNEMLANMNSDIAGIVHNLEIVVNSVQKIESNTDKILEELKAIRASKETGPFEKISETENKKKIIDAVKTIVLIAAGVLAMGLAFKLISPVNFLSAIAIGLAIVFVAGAFVMVAALTEDISWADTFRVSSMMVIMATGLAVSSWALALSSTITLAKMTSIVFTATALGASLVLMAYAIKKADLKPMDYIKFMFLPLILPIIALGIAISSIILSAVRPMSLAQIATTVFVATAIGVSLFLISMALEKSKIDGKKVGQFLMLATIIPALALGLVIASFILSKIHPLTLMQMISSVFVAITIGVLVYLMKPLIDKMKDFSLGQILNVTLMVAAIAAGLVVASWILTKMSFFTFKECLQLIMSSLAIGLAVLFLTPAVYVLKSIDPKDMLKAATNIVIAAGAIMVSSWLLNLGTYDNYPDWEWSVGSGLAIVAFAGIIKLIDYMKLGIKEMATGALAVLGISAVIMLTSWILGIGNYEDYPSFGWAMGVGLSLVAFGGSMMILGLIISGSGGAAAAALAIGALATMGVALVIAAVSWILGLGNYEDYPSFDWAMGVGLSLVAFGGAMVVLGLALPLLILGALSMGIIAYTIAEVSNIISKGSYTTGPTDEWAKAVSLLMNEFSWVMIKTSLIPNMLLERCAEGLMIIAQNIVDISNVLSQGNYKGGPTSNWATSTGTLLTSFATASLIVGLSLPFLLFGLGGMMTIAQAIVDVSNKLSEGTYTGGPTELWAKGVGLSIKAFAEGIAALQSTDSIWSIFGEDQGKKITDIADAMVLANKTLASVSWSKNYPSEGWAKGVGGAIMAFANALATLDKADIDGTDFLFDVMWLSLGIIAAAKILSEYGDWDDAKYPSEKWSTGVGNAIKTFAEPLAKLAEFDVTGSDITRSIRRLARGLVDAAEIISEYKDWDTAKYPNDKWVTGVGGAIGTFVKYLVEIEKNDIGRGDIKNLNKVIKAIIFTATAFAVLDKVGIWDSYPPPEWATNVGEAIGTFVKYLIDIEKNDIGRGDIRNLNRIIDSMVMTALTFSAFALFGNIWKNYPDDKWSTGVGKAIGTFVKYLVEIEKYDIGKGDIRNLNRVIDSMIDVAFKLSINANIWKNYPSSEWADGVGKSIETFIGHSYDIDINNLKNMNNVIDSMISIAKKLSVSADVWKNYPSSEWADGVGKSIGSFVKYLIGIDKNKVDIKNLNNIIDSMVNAAKKLGVDIWKNYPSPEWAEGVGQSIKTFIKIDSSDIKIENINDVVDSMIDIANKLNKNGDIWNSYPPVEWSDGVLRSIRVFTYSINMLSGLDENKFYLLSSAGKSMIEFATKLQSLDKFKALFIPGGILDIFSNSMKQLVDSLPTNEAVSGLKTLGEALNSISTMGMSSTNSIYMLSMAMSKLGETLRELDFESLDKLSKFSNGMLVLSLIDDKKLEEALTIMQKKRDDIKSILSDNPMEKTKTATPVTTGVIEAAGAPVTESSNRDDFYKKMLEHIESLDTNVLKIVNKEPEVSTSGNDEKTREGSKVNA